MATLRSDSAETLRWALLVALSFPALEACGGATETTGESDDGADGGGGRIIEAGSGGFTSSGGSGSGGAVVQLVCSSPQPWLDGVETGFVRCSEGFRHRSRAIECPSALPRAGEREPGTWGIHGIEDECSKDTDCSGTHPYCESTTSIELAGFANVCRDGCVTDSECGSGQICECGDPVGHCVRALCREDGDCAPGSLCVGTDTSKGCGTDTGYACAVAADSCLSDQDCAGSNGKTCQWNDDGTRSCQVQTCAIGRPFLVNFAERRASLQKRSDWIADIGKLDTTRLSKRDRAALSAHWAEMGLMEHASIPAFARFALQLLSLEAPSSLVEASKSAIADETLHARLCFAIASQYGQENVGPGTIRMAGALDDLSIESILYGTIVEGCIGETRAALEAARARDLCEDPVIRDVLTIIARDEAKHAELAWRFVSWMLGEYPSLSRLFEETIRLGHAPRASNRREDRAASAHLERLGVLSPLEQARVREDAWMRVIVPSAAALSAKLRKPRASHSDARAFVAVHS